MVLALLAMLATIALVGGVFLSNRKVHLAAARGGYRATKALLLTRNLGNFAADIRAEHSIHGSLAIAFVIIGAVVSILVAATLAPQYIRAVGNASSAVATTSFGNTTADSLRPVFALLLALGGLIGIVVLILGVLALKHGS